MRFFLSAILLASTSLAAWAQTGLHQPFANNGVAVFDTGTCSRIIVQPDGRILVTGAIKSTGIMYPALVSRFLDDGNFDPSFGQGGSIFFSPDPNSVFFRAHLPLAVALQQDGKIVIGAALGTVTSTNGDSIMLTRLLPNGTPDNSFGTNGLVIRHLSDNVLGDDALTSIALQPDGKIITYGTAYGPPAQGANKRLALARFLPDGGVDSSFGSNGKVLTDISANAPTTNDVALAGNGRIVAGAKFSLAGIGSVWAAVRYRPDGKRDSTFGINGVAYATVAGLSFSKNTKLQADGKVVISGYNDSLTVIRFDTTGLPDASFGTAGRLRIEAADKAGGLVFQSNGSMIVGATGADSAFVIHRRLPNGSPDPSFGTGGRISTKVLPKFNVINDLALLPDGKIIAAGYGEKLPSPNHAPFGLLACYTASGTAVEHVKARSTVSIWPNPASGFVVIDAGSKDEVSEVALYGLDGRLIKKARLPENKTWALPDVPKCMYLLQVTLKSGDNAAQMLQIAGL